MAALTVRKIWGPGTLVGAAATPVIITLVAELLRRPATRMTVLGSAPRAPGATSGAPRYDPVAAGRSGLRAGADPVFSGSTTLASTRPRRRAWIALTGGLLAFAVGAVLLTGSELILGDSSVGSSGNRTTIFPGRRGGTTTTPTGTTPTTSTAEGKTTAPDTATPTPTQSTPAPTTSTPAPATTRPAPATPAPAVPPAATTTAAPDAGVVPPAP